jgi:AcrR family transcriptional regulator
MINADRANGAAPTARGTRERIDAIALGLFAEKGVDQTTTRDIAQGAGVAEGTLYRHYPSKDAMVRDLFVAHYGRMAAELDRLQAAETGVNAKIAAMVGAFCDLFESDPAVFRFLFLVQHGQLSHLPADLRTPVDVVRDSIEAAIRNGEIPDQDPTLATAMVFGLVTQPAVFKIYNNLPAPMTDMAPRLARACMHVLNA